MKNPRVALPGHEIEEGEVELSKVHETELGESLISWLMQSILWKNCAETYETNLIS